MTEILHQPGFLGTTANFAADVTLILSLLVAGLFSLGFVVARRGNYVAHGRIQTIGALLNIVLVLWFMILPYRDFIVRDLGGPRPGFFYRVTQLHALVGFFAFTFGNFVVLRGHKLVPRALRFERYKPYMRAAYALYMLTTLLGVGVYITWFVLIANTPVFE